MHEQRKEKENRANVRRDVLIVCRFCRRHHSRDGMGISPLCVCRTSTCISTPDAVAADDDKEEKEKVRQSAGGWERQMLSQEKAQTLKRK